MPRNDDVYAARARAKKVAALGEYIWERLSPVERRSLQIVETCRNATPAQREDLARKAGQRAPSDDSWALLLVWLEKHVRWARQEAA